MKKLFYALSALGLVLSGCTKETTTVIEPGAENPSIIALCQGDFINDGENIVVGIDKLPLAISATSANVDVRSYQWAVNNETEEGATTGKYAFNSEWTGKFPVSVTAISTDNKTSELSFTIEVEGPYKSGAVIYSSSYADLAFQGKDSYYPDLMSKLSLTGGGTVQDIYIENNVIYFLISDGRIVAADAQTFKKIEKYGTFSGIATPFRFIKAGEGKFYVSTDNMDRAKQGLWVYKEQPDGTWAISATAIAGTDLAPASKPVKAGGRILVGTGSDIAVIDPATDALVAHDKNGITINSSRRVTDVLIGKDGYIYAVAYSTSQAATSSVIRIDPSDFSFIEEVELLEGTAANKVYQTPWQAQAHAAASLSTDEIFIMGSGGIYSYDYNGKTTRKLASVSFGYSTYALNYMQMGVDMENLYFATSTYSGSKVEKIGIATGIRSTLRSDVTGDASIMSTYQFPGR